MILKQLFFVGKYRYKPVVSERWNRDDWKVLCMVILKDLITAGTFYSAL